MKKTALGLLLLLGINNNIYSQEYVVDSIDRKKYTGVHTTGDMGQIVNIPYFSTNKSSKQNFIIRQLRGDNLLEEGAIRLEVPATYTFKCLAYNMQNYLLVFADDSKKEDILMTVAGGNVLKKKTVKQTGNSYYNANNMGEYNVLFVVDKKGNYYLEAFDAELNSKWKKEYTAPKGVTYDILSAEYKMSNVELLRKETSDNGKYVVKTVRLQCHNGQEVAAFAINNDTVKAYPVLFEEHEGMNYNAGYFYKNGIYTDKPDGVYLASLQSDGNIYQMYTVPYSRIVEDVKETLGNKLMDNNSTLVFMAVKVSHESQEYYVSGQMINRKIVDGGAEITMGDFVTLKFDFENQYKGAFATKNEGWKIKLTGDVTKVNMVDLGRWLADAGIMQFKSYGFLPAAYPIISYVNKDKNNGMGQLCYVNVVKPEKELPELCVPITEHPTEERTYEFKGISAPAYPVLTDYISFHPHMITAIYTYELHDGVLRIRRKEMPNLEPIRIQYVHNPEPPAGSNGN